MRKYNINATIPMSTIAFPPPSRLDQKALILSNKSSPLYKKYIHFHASVSN